MCFAIKLRKYIIYVIMIEKFIFMCMNKRAERIIKKKLLVFHSKTKKILIYYFHFI